MSPAIRPSVLVALLGLLAACGGPDDAAAPAPAPEVRPEAQSPVWREGRARSADGHPIAYTEGGSGEPALVFLHCGFCDRGIWSGRLEPHVDRHRVVALDLAGHGDSQPVRQNATRAAFAEDVRAVADAVGIERMILVGSSFGGVVALDAAALLPGRVLGIVAVDTLHDLTAEWDQEAWRSRVEAFRTDFAVACAEMMGQLFHPDADPALRDRLHRDMCGRDPELALSIFGAFDDYDWLAAARGAAVPIRAIQGDLYPTAVEANRTVVPGYDAVILDGVGHFPMLEAPERFDRELAEAVAALASTAPVFASGSRPGPRYTAFWGR